uniref:Reverse transcriptase/retrotransposon-derived protein RNase H-like domain-containing protein n=1 Tax=Solanum lycopersicum TaxID=4081 RepID=A0A3Q7GPT9_SOLLC
MEKCEFAQQEIKFLGHLVSKNQVRMDPKKVHAIVDWQAPRHVKDLRSFLGLANYYRKFIACYSKKAASLTDLLKKDAKWVWSKQCEEAFQNLKNAIASEPILKLPDFELPFEVHTDASDKAIGGERYGNLSKSPDMTNLMFHLQVNNNTNNNDETVDHQSGFDPRTKQKDSNMNNNTYKDSKYHQQTLTITAKNQHIDARRRKRLEKDRRYLFRGSGTGTSTSSDRLPHNPSRTTARRPNEVTLRGRTVLLF